MLILTLPKLIKLIIMKSILTSFLILISVFSYAQQYRDYYRLSQVQYNPSTFQAAQYNPQQSNHSTYNSLSRTFEIIAQREKEASQQLSNLNVLLANYALILNNDELTLTWYENFKRKYLDTVEEFIRFGDHATAIEYAIRYQGEIVNNAELLARIRTSKEYKEKITLINSTIDLDWNSKQNMIADNPYCFVPYKNDEGEIIGGRLGSKAELQKQIEDAKLEAERKRQEEMRLAKEKQENEERIRLLLEQPFDNYDYQSNGYFRIIDNPSYEIENGPKDKRYYRRYVKVTRVAISHNNTRIEFKLKCRYFDLLSKKIHIKAGGKKLKPISSDNIELSENGFYRNNLYMFHEGTIKFALIFPALPENAKSLDFIESVKDGIKIKNLKLE